MLIDLVIQKTICIFALLKRNIISDLIFFHILTEAVVKHPQLFFQKKKLLKYLVIPKIIVPLHRC